MNIRPMARWLAVAGALGLFSTTKLLLADDSSTPHSWTWPLYKRVDNADGTVSPGEPRPAVWTQVGEFQKYASGTYLHNGIDIRGDKGDPTVLPVDATIVAVFLYGSDCTAGGTSNGHCRVWFETADKHFLFYFGHLDLSTTASTNNRPISNDLRTKVQTVIQQVGAPGYTNEGQPGDAGVWIQSTVTATRGTIVAPLYPFGIYSGYPTWEWEHLHLGIYDRTHNDDLYDAILLLEQNPQGGQSKLSRALVDDTPPIVHEVDFLKPGTTTSVTTNGTCGTEIDPSSGASNVAVEALIDDVFFPDRSGSDYASFPNKPGSDPSVSDPQTTDVRAIRTSFVKVADGSTAAPTILWDDLSKWTEQTCADTNLQSTMGCFPPPPFVMSDSALFQYVSYDFGASSGGEDMLGTLWDVGRSSSTYNQPNGEIYWHLVTNQASESSAYVTTTTPGSWSLSSLATEMYQVSVEAEDWAGNLGALSRFVVVRQSGDSLTPNASNGLAHAYIKDNDTDTGAIPSTLGGKPFWASPDIFVVPQGVTVDPNGDSVETLVSASGKFDVYLRVHNDSVCGTVHNPVAKIWVADPNALSNAFDSAANITGGAYQAGGNPVSSISSGSFALLGPFTWSVDPSYTGDGHKCLLAAIKSDEENAASNEGDAPGSNQVAQRNIQLTNCEYPITNATTNDGTVTLTLTQDNQNLSPTLGGPVDLELAFSDADGAWGGKWNPGNHPAYSSSTTGGITTVRLGASTVPLPVVPLHAGESRSVSMAMSLPAGTATTKLSIGVSFSAASGSYTLSNGGSCESYAAPPTPPIPPCCR